MNRKVLIFVFILISFLNAELSTTTILFEDKVTKSMANQYLGNPLFFYPYSSSYSFKKKPGDGWWLLGFAVDPVWNRIIYGDYNDDWLKAFGKFGTGNDGFRSPKRITSSPTGEVYVVDEFNGRIVKLIYNFQNKTLSYLTSFGEEVLKLPVDVDLDIKGTLNDPSDDEIWVLDGWHSKIYHFKANGQLIDSYGEFGQGQGKFYYPEALAKSLWGNSLYILDKGNDRIVKIKYRGINNYEWVKEFHFSHGANYTSIEVDYEGGVWLTKRGCCRIDKFTPDLEPLCKIGKKGTDENEFIYPEEISIAKGYGNIFIIEQWTDSSGGQHYIPGMDILNLSASHQELFVKIYFKITWNGKVTITIYNENWNHIRTLYNNYYFPLGAHTVYWDMKDAQGNLVPLGKYFIKISVKNLWSNEYTKVDTTSVILTYLFK